MLFFLFLLCVNIIPMLVILVNVMLILMFYCQYYVVFACHLHVSFFIHVNVHVIFIKCLCHLFLFVSLLRKYLYYGVVFVLIVIH